MPPISSQHHDNYEYNPNFNPNDGDPNTTPVPSDWQILNEENVAMSQNNIWDDGESTTSNISETNNYSNVIFKNSDWLYKLSPRIRISHVIADGATAFVYQYRGETAQYQLNFARFEQGIKNMQSLLVNKYEYIRSTYIPRTPSQVLDLNPRVM